MAINRFYKAPGYKFQSQYVPLPLEYMQKQLEGKQKQLDTARAGRDAMEEKLLAVDALEQDTSGRNTAIDAYEQEAQSIIDDYKDTPAALAGKMGDLRKRINKDMTRGELGAIQRSHAARSEYVKDLDKRLKEGKLLESDYRRLVAASDKSYAKGIGQADDLGNYNVYSGRSAQNFVNIPKKAMKIAKEVSPQVVASTTKWNKITREDGTILWEKSGVKTSKMPKEVLEKLILPMLQQDKEVMGYAAQDVELDMTDQEMSEGFSYIDEAGMQVDMSPSDLRNARINNQLVNAASGAAGVYQSNDILSRTEDMKFDPEWKHSATGKADAISNLSVSGTGSTLITHNLDDIRNTNSQLQSDVDISNKQVLGDLRNSGIADYVSNDSKVIDSFIANYTDGKAEGIAKLKQLNNLSDGDAAKLYDDYYEAAKESKRKQAVIDRNQVMLSNWETASDWDWNKETPKLRTSLKESIGGTYNAMAQKITDEEIKKIVTSDWSNAESLSKELWEKYGDTSNASEKVVVWDNVVKAIKASGGEYGKVIEKAKNEGFAAYYTKFDFADIDDTKISTANQVINATQALNKEATAVTMDGVSTTMGDVFGIPLAKVKNFKSSLIADSGKPRYIVQGTVGETGKEETIIKIVEPTGKDEEVLNFMHEVSRKGNTEISKKSAKMYIGANHMGDFWNPESIDNMDAGESTTVYDSEGNKIGTAEKIKPTASGSSPYLLFRDNDGDEITYKDNYRFTKASDLAIMIGDAVTRGQEKEAAKAAEEAK